MAGSEGKRPLVDDLFQPLLQFLSPEELYHTIEGVKSKVLGVLSEFASNLSKSEAQRRADTVAFDRQVFDLKSQLNTVNTKIAVLEQERSASKIQFTQAPAEKDDLLSIVEKRNVEIDKLTQDMKNANDKFQQKLKRVQPMELKIEKGVSLLVREYPAASNYDNPMSFAVEATGNAGVQGGPGVSTRNDGTTLPSFSGGSDDRFPRSNSSTASPVASNIAEQSTQQPMYNPGLAGGDCFVGNQMMNTPHTSTASHQYQSKGVRNPPSYSYEGTQGQSTDFKNSYAGGGPNFNSGNSASSTLSGTSQTTDLNTSMYGKGHLNKIVCYEKPHVTSGGYMTLGAGANPLNSQLSRRTYGSRKRLVDDASYHPIDVRENSQADTPTEKPPQKVNKWNEFPSAEDWDNEEYTGSLQETKVFTPSTQYQVAPPLGDTTGGGPNHLGSSVSPGQSIDLSLLQQKPPNSSNVTNVSSAGANLLPTLQSSHSNQVQLSNTNQPLPPRHKVQRPRSITTNIPSSAVEMPGDSVTTLNVQFGGLESDDNSSMSSNSVIHGDSTKSNADIWSGSPSTNSAENSEEYSDDDFLSFKKKTFNVKSKKSVTIASDSDDDVVYFSSDNAKSKKKMRKQKSGEQVSSEDEITINSDSSSSDEGERNTRISKRAKVASYSDSDLDRPKRQKRVKQVSEDSDSDHEHGLGYGHTPGHYGTRNQQQQQTVQSHNTNIGTSSPTSPPQTHVTHHIKSTTPRLIVEPAVNKTTHLEMEQFAKTFKDKREKLGFSAPDFAPVPQPPPLGTVSYTNSNQYENGQIVDAMPSAGPNDSYIIVPKSGPPNAKMRRLAKDSIEKQAKPEETLPDIVIPYSALVYMAIKNHPDQKCLPSDIVKFALYYFPVLTKYKAKTTKQLSRIRRNCERDGWLLQTKVGKSSAASSLWSIKGVPSRLSKWKKLVPNGLLAGVKYRKLIRGKLKKSFDLDGNLLVEDNIPVRKGKDFSICEIMEELIKLKGNSLSSKALVSLIKEKYPDVAASHPDKYLVIAQNLILTKPWIKQCGKSNGTSSPLLSVDESRKGLPMLSREFDVPPKVFEVMKEAVRFKILNNESNLSWYFFEVDENGKEIKDEKTTDTNRLIHARLTTAPGKYKTFVSFFTKNDKESSKTEYAINFGTTTARYVTGGHAANMVNVERAMTKETLGPGQSRRLSACSGPKELMNEDKGDNDDHYDSNLWNTNYWDALGLYSAPSYRIIQRVRNLLRKLFVCMGNNQGYYANWSTLAVKILKGLPFTRHIDFTPPKGYEVQLG